MARFPKLQGTTRRGGGGEVRLGTEEASLKYPGHLPMNDGWTRSLPDECCMDDEKMSQPCR